MSPVPNVSSEIGYFPYLIGSERKPYKPFPVFLQVSLPRLGHRLSYFRSNVQSRYVSIFISAQRWWTPFFWSIYPARIFVCFFRDCIP